MVTHSITNDSGGSHSIWRRAKVPSYDAPLPEQTRTDVCVIGAGVAGLTTAYLLLREGKRVVVVDGGPIGGGESGRTTAHLASVQDDRFSHLERRHSTKTLRLVTESHASAIDRIESICASENIQCGFRRVDGYLFNPTNGSKVFLEREAAAAKRAGLISTELVQRAPLPGFDTGPAIRFPRQAQLHPVAYLRGLARAIEHMGGHIYAGAHVGSLSERAPMRVGVRGGRRVLADTVVVATNAPIVSPLSIPMKQSAYRTYVVAFAIPKGAVPLGLYWDTEVPYHYARLVGDDSDGLQDTLIVGGEDHKTGQANDMASRYERLEQWARSRFPSAGALVGRWSGQIMEPVDGLAFIGRAPGQRDVYLITGDSGQGMTNGTLGAMLVTDLVVGRDNPWEGIYDPSRKPVRSGYELVKANLNVAKQYFDWLRRGEVGAIEQIPPGTGALVRRGAKLLAVYRDDRGTCHALSAVCTHMGGIVAWNAAEKSWDCPCHGSRFDVRGRVLNGPACRDLEPGETTPTGASLPGSTLPGAGLPAPGPARGPARGPAPAFRMRPSRG